MNETPVKPNAGFLAECTQDVHFAIDVIAPARSEQRGTTRWLDFGRAAFATLRITFPSDPRHAEWHIRLGEKLAADGSIDRNPPGSVNVRQLHLETRPEQREYTLRIPPKPFHLSDAPVDMPASIGEVTPFRYAEIEGSTALPATATIRQCAVHAAFDDNASTFASSDATLNAVWELCKYTIKATTAFGVYIDGERERIPYEADAYLNMLSHYACDLDPRVARATCRYLLRFPTWPTEWSLHMPMIVAADYLATGDLALARDCYELLKPKLLQEHARADGLLVASAIVDWPAGERDGYNHGETDPAQPKQVGPLVNTVANGFFIHALRQMAFLAGALGRASDAQYYTAAAEHATASFNHSLFDAERGIYTDGEGSSHASLHANMVPLAFGLVPVQHRQRVADFVESRGMACSVYGAQYLLEALFAAGKDAYAVGLMTARTTRSWWNMIELGSTMTLEAWDASFKPNLTWNHAWGAVPANIIARFVLGVRPLEPGSTRLLVAPQPGGLAWMRGTVPTAAGPVALAVENGQQFTLQVELPAGVQARVVLPRRSDQPILWNGQPYAASSEGATLVIDGVGTGRHVFVAG